ncbi:MAG TPA: aldo/keto reductase [Spirochaetaceae bacterium]|jgi:aryl-alcohol dehydrogenase-like predicted oxidoreductase|nr:aldo/keto reductase [Spirochaetaceae bacterium]
MIEKMEFGGTGHTSTRALFGAAAFWRVSQDEADRTMAVLEEYGVNHIDTAASYGDSELRLGPWLKHNRKRVFLATKTEKRGYREAKEELGRSLERLQVDSVDLWQMHILVDPRDWELAMSEDGALRAFVEARDEGLVRFLGVTGHGVTTPFMHLKSLERYPFDSVLLPYNYPMLLNAEYKSGFERLAAVCKERNIALQAIKTLAKGPKREGAKNDHATWYEPLAEAEDIEIAIHWALGNEQLFINTAGDIGLLPLILKAFSSFNSKIRDEDMEKFTRAKGMTTLFE